VKNFEIIVDFTDIVNTVVAVPNIIAAVILSSVVSKAYKNYLSKK
jgi:Na+/alanine symporter